MGKGPVPLRVGACGVHVPMRVPSPPQRAAWWAPHFLTLAPGLPLSPSLHRHSLHKFSLDVVSMEFG